eukprot:TRINITY_DN10092_c0_g1_i2.p1 TRINITY_DN10092_c0_g1~~TRINITY_DN10092_c0_g1_i2.p1  ORF type:complete len:115 (-),score=19.13 TRINITY_DN10092_c0_g1_i2:177-521(-)
MDSPGAGQGQFSLQDDLTQISHLPRANNSPRQLFSNTQETPSAAAALRRGGREARQEGRAARRRRQRRLPTTAAATSTTQPPHAAWRWEARTSRAVLRSLCHPVSGENMVDTLA